MFEALFILTIIAAGTRVGRFMLQDLFGHVFPPLRRTNWMPGVLVASAAIVAGLGLFPLSGRARSVGRHQFAVAAVRHRQSIAGRDCAVRRHNHLDQDASRAIHVDHRRSAGLAGDGDCFTAGWEKIFSDQPRLGFLADAARLQSALDAGKIAAAKIAETRGQIFNDRLDAVVCGIFMVLVR